MKSTRWTTSLLATALIGVAACEDGLSNQPRYEPLERSTLFADGSSARSLVEGTIARGTLPESVEVATGRTPDGQLLARDPMPIDLPMLRRGRERFEIFCAPCHSRTGDGNGMIVQRGYTQPSSFHSERLRAVPDGHLFDVITTGFGTMPSYSHQVSVADRWAIVAYIRALQRSTAATIEDVPEPQRRRLEGGGS